MKYEKTLSNIQEVTARSGRVIAIAIEGDEEIKHLVEHTIQIPQAPELLLPVLEVVPLQLLAYHIAVRRGCDVDQPRNLAKERHGRINLHSHQMKGSAMDDAYRLMTSAVVAVE